MPEKDTENVESGLNKEGGVVSSTGSRLEKMENNKNSKVFSGGDIVSTDKLKKGFTATQKVIAFFGSILSLIVAGFTVNNLMNGKPAKPTDNNTPTTSIVKIIEKSNTSSVEKNKETKPSTNNNAEEKKNESNDKTSDSSSPREKEIVREIIREIPATTTTSVVEQDLSSNTDPNTKSSGEDNHPKGEGETKPSLSEGKSE